MFAETAEDSKRGCQHGEEPENHRPHEEKPSAIGCLILFRPPPDAAAPPPRARHEHDQHAQAERTLHGPTARHGAVIKMDAHGDDHLENVQPHGHGRIEDAPRQGCTEKLAHGMAFGMGLRIDRERAGGGGEEKEECKV